MNCPRCDGQITVYELEDAVSRVCEDCSYVGVLADHRSTDIDTESWDDALTRLRTEFSESDPDGVSRVDDDTAPPDDAGDGDGTTDDTGLQFRGAPESTRVSESGPQPEAEAGGNVTGQSSQADPGSDSEAATDETPATQDDDAETNGSVEQSGVSENSDDAEPADSDGANDDHADGPETDGAATEAGKPDGNDGEDEPDEAE